MAESRVYLPKLESPPDTILDYLGGRFPHIPLATWRQRMARGLVTIAGGAAVQADSPYRYGVTVHYQRETPSEPEPLESETILYRDAEMLVADKPHGMPVTPAGDYVARALLSRLERATGSTDIAPLHRLDRETAGLVLFSLNPKSRARYHDLFQTRAIAREYLAVAEVSMVPAQRRWRVENRLGAGVPWFRQEAVEGPVNAITEIELFEAREGRGLFRLTPQTGRKHQLRIHMASIGFPILGDPLYPEIIKVAEPEHPPLQLLARTLSFVDPLTGTLREFHSTRTLESSGVLGTDS